MRSIVRRQANANVILADVTAVDVGRKVLATTDFVRATGRQAQPGPEGGRPADTYIAGRHTELFPPLKRTDRS